MIKPDWSKFKAKFSDNPQSNFEWFCYLLFCREFDMPLGISRFKNQAGVETNPISFGNKVIGWQAKFYDTSLSQHRNEILKSIKDSKNKYPEINKFIFFTNQEWGQGKKKNDPAAKIDAEKVASELGIELEWRTASFFESPLVVLDNEIISQHFFELRSIIDSLEEKNVHSERILKDIHTSIEFNGKHIEFERNNILNQVKDELKHKQVLIISGVAGVGKTAVIKKLYSLINNEVPIYIFKSSEFNVNNINSLFSDFSLDEFILVHKDQSEKIVIFDSAEKLLDLQNTDPIKEFLHTLIDNGWRLIFTTRYNYLEDLNFQFIDIYKINPRNFTIPNPSLEDLKNLSINFNFELPDDHKLLDLIANPFYLNEYLKLYNPKDKLSYQEFREKLWNKIIKKANPIREQCFMQIAFQRSNEGQFFVTPSCDSQVLIQFVQDGILGYESAGYFITHDIYEEWALEKIIESNFIKKQNNNQFFENLGKSLAIRRSFRNWLSQKLFFESDSIKNFIEEILSDDYIDLFWKDETIVAVLLSDYSDSFFNELKEKLLEGNFELLRRITFLLRIACKEIDNDFFKSIGVKDDNILSMKYVFTKPKGRGWNSFIKFVYEHLDRVGEPFIGFILPVLNDWNSKIREGETTRHCSLLALKYYQWTIQEDVRWSNRNNEEKLTETILFGSIEIKVELKNIFDEVISRKWKSHRDPYNELVEKILTGLGTNIEVIRHLPESVISLMDLFLFKSEKEGYDPFHYRNDIGQYFGMEDEHLEYYPTSSFQTPTYWLLQSSFKMTIDFILSFTNKTIEYYSKSTLDRSQVEEIDVTIEEGKTIKQYISHRVWCLYRGTQVAPHALEAMHMALEKFLLEVGKDLDSKTLESWLIYLLKNSRSASISASVTSIVLAYPDKTFNVAVMLFQTKEFFLYDTSRYILDQTAQSQFSIGLGINSDKDIHSKERLKTCEDKHRGMSLEHLARNYQFFKTDEMRDEEFKKRQEQVWKILDEHYEKLPDKQSQNSDDKTWQLYLARIDRRKMNLTTEEKEGRLLINLNPELEPDLKNYSENSLQDISERTKYTSLSLWANLKIKNDLSFKQYEKYENNPLLALKEVKDIVKQFKKKVKYDYDLLNHSIPPNVCSVLIRDYIDKLSISEKKFCKKIILETASSTFKENYQYQIFDGVGNTISILPILLKHFPGDRKAIKTILFIVLFDNHPLGFSGKFSDYAINALHGLWKISFDDAKSILLGYLLLCPIYEKTINTIRRENHKKGIYQISLSDVNKRFIEENEDKFKSMIDNTITINNLKEINKLDSNSLNTAFALIPLGTENENLKILSLTIVNSICHKFFSVDESEIDERDYRIKYDFFRRFAHFLLSSELNEIPILLKFFLDNFNKSEIFENFFQELISAEDSMEEYEKFWIIWELFFEKIKILSNSGQNDKIIRSYLFALTPWKETAKEWHSLKENEKKFFKKISVNLGNNLTTLYSISKLLNEVGSNFLNEGVSWISDMLKKNNKIWKDKLETNTIYYLEGLIRKFIYIEREKIRKNIKLKNEVLVILDFLVEKGSVTGYLLRENIL